MNINLKNKKYLIALPALAALFIALIPTIKYQWPLGWDIIYHVQYAQVYTQYGFTLTDPQLNAPFGRKIAYLPLFHFLIAGIGSFLDINYFQVARILQPILAVSIVLSVSYVAKKFYGTLAGVGAGFLILSSYLVSRIILPLPENLALIFLPLAVYLYYKSLENKNLKTAFFGGILFLIILLTHQGATLCLILSVIAITILELLVYRNINVLKNFTSFFLALILIIVTGLISLQLVAPQTLQNLMQQGITAITGLSTSLPINRSLGLFSYLGNLGILVLIFSLIGGISILKKIQMKEFMRKDLVILVWILSMFLLSNAYWFGINVISYRVLIYLLIPLSILGGYGINVIYQKLKNNERFSSKNVHTIFLVAILCLSLFSGIFTVENPKIATYGIKNQEGYIQTAPPSDAEVDLANWFNENGNSSRYVVISNQFTGMFLAADTNMSFREGFQYFSTNSNVTIEEKGVKSSTLANFKKANVGYVVYDKRLVTSPEEKTLSLRVIDTEFFPLQYFTQDIQSNINRIKPEFSRVVYENEDFIVCEINW
ncbi:MAG: hypothetical protein A4E25_01415 [Methanobacterium sp. PtaB.Bin024]|jgi:hypothetical protein|nr:MAG: hypothetical protein A4E25_01415 [Methanobacterium sp. PtaB.Bin024]